MKQDKIAFAMGCFWTPQLIFSKVPGVNKVIVGYMGGAEEKKNYTYEEVCSGKTGHAETVFIKFDSDEVSYEELLDLFWKNHDPTTMNRQGPDVGTQYRSVIFYFNEEQREKAEQSKKIKQLVYEKTIVTQIVPAGNFYQAEEYHQEYLRKHDKESCKI